MRPEQATATVMAAEIREIPSLVGAQLSDPAAVEAASAALRARRPSWVSLVARGTSDHAATYGRYLLEGSLGVPVGLAAPSLTTIYGLDHRWDGAALVAVSQSGRGPDVIAVVERARDGGALTIAITNDPRSPLADAADHVIPCAAGPERAVAATKTYVAELVALAMLAASLRPGGPIAEALDRLPAALERTVERATGWVQASGVVDALASTDRCLVASRGYNLATALEIALKLKETAALFAEGYSTADLLHGPVVLAAPGVPVLVVRPDGPMGRSIDEALGRVAAAGSPTWLVGARGVEPRASVAGSAVLALPVDLPEELTPMPFAVVGQLVSEAVARARGFDPDAPVGLEKVTMTR